MGSSRAPRSGFKNLTGTQKVIYVSAVGFVWLKRQIKMSEKEFKEVEEMKAMTEAAPADLMENSSKFRCFFAAQQYHMLGSTSPEEEKAPEVQRMLEVLAQCKEDLYHKLPAETPCMRPLHSPQV